MENATEIRTFHLTIFYGVMLTRCGLQVRHITRKRLHN